MKTSYLNQNPKNNQNLRFTLHGYILSLRSETCIAIQMSQTYNKHLMGIKVRTMVYILHYKILQYFSFLIL